LDATQVAAETTPASAPDTMQETTNPATLEGTTVDDEPISGESDGKIDATKVNEIVKGRVEKVRAKTRAETEAKVRSEVEQELEFWMEKAANNKVDAGLWTLPPEPKLTDSNSVDVFTKDHKAWTEQKVRMDMAKQQVQSEYNARAAKFATENPDFTKAVKFFNAVSVPAALDVSILESEHGPAIAYYLSKNLKEFNRISQLSPVSIAREVGKIELKVTGQVSEPKPAAPKQPAAPKPTTTVTGSAPAGSASDLLKQGNKQAYIDAEKARLRGTAVPARNQ